MRTPSRKTPKPPVGISQGVFCSRKQRSSKKSGRDCGLGRLHQAGKRTSIAHGQIGQNLAVQFHACLLETVHELAVADAILTCRRIDAGDPKPPKITLAVAPITIGIPQRLHHRFVGTPEETALGSSLSLGYVEYALMPPMGNWTTFYSCHDTSPSRLVAARPRRDTQSKSIWSPDKEPTA